jgi:hypothetical protein
MLLRNVEGKTEVGVPSLCDTGNEDTIFGRICTGREDEIPDLKSRSGFAQALRDTSVLEPIQVGVLKFLKCSVGYIDMNNRAVVGGTERIGSSSEDGKLVDRLLVPRVEDVRKEGKEKMYTDARANDKIDRIARDVPSTCAQR